MIYQLFNCSNCIWCTKCTCTTSTLWLSMYLFIVLCDYQCVTWLSACHV